MVAYISNVSTQKAEAGEFKASLVHNLYSRPDSPCVKKKKTHSIGPALAEGLGLYRLNYFASGFSSIVLFLPHKSHEYSYSKV